MGCVLYHIFQDKRSSLCFRDCLWAVKSPIHTICKNAFSLEVSKVGTVLHIDRNFCSPIELPSSACPKAVSCSTDHMGIFQSVRWQGKAQCWELHFLTDDKADDSAFSITGLWMCFSTKRHGPRCASYPQAKHPKCCLFLSIGKLCLLQNNKNVS